MYIVKQWTWFFFIQVILSQRTFLLVTFLQTERKTTTEKEEKKNLFKHFIVHN